MYKRQGLSERVKLIGFVADDDLPALYSAADLLAFPSLYEGFGLPLLEAMACGAPVLSSDASSLPEVAGDGAALLLSPHDEAGWSAALIDLLGDDAARRRLRQAGLARSAHFKWSAAAHELAALYRRLLAAARA